MGGIASERCQCSEALGVIFNNPAHSNKKGQQIAGLFHFRFSIKP